MAVTKTAMRNELSKTNVAKLEEIFTNAGIEFFRTGANMNTLTFEAGQIDGKPVYGSIKFTLHKEDFSLDDEVEEFEMLVEERGKKVKDKEIKDAKALKDRELRDAKLKAKADAEAKAKEKRRAALAEEENTEEKEGE